MTTCKLCGLAGLRWVEMDGKWRLYQDQTLHLCGKFRRQTAIAAERGGKLVLPKPSLETAFNKGAWKQKEKPEDKPPPEALYDFRHVWWSWIDAEPKKTARPEIAKQQEFAEMVP